MTRSVTNKEQSIFLHLYRSSELHHSNMRLFHFVLNQITDVALSVAAILFCPALTGTDMYRWTKYFERKFKLW